MLDKRLLAIANLIRKGSYVCDVGTDHAYLPCYLVKEGITKQCVACDINEMPLQSAKEHIQSYGFEAQIETILSDGLKNVPSAKAQDIVIAGMGGELIAKILQGVSYTKEKDKRFLLQPMTFVPYLRKYLCENGYEILSEMPVIDKNKTYTILCVAYTGVVKEPSALFLLVGKIPENQSEEAKIYIQRQYQKQIKIAKSIEESSEKKDKAQQYYQIAFELKDLLNKKEG
ncbi:class I SAM-dependent methyltransferase [Paludicola sp. MB14-C6]|uniref:tRNA (adenine(22)-N(1))-methyltransferase n=1 Tax=Paludihabitans sp. MB14-C6 TaxID=3070656 RepID=UPI0027DDC3A0|nr:class I SAM-dependent methyltransferase [Paludicola sp. MB14-C6]WMJ22600.1 class I SAM-dependent methyltransferase [Paludicola sp. MB14-C6]